MRLIKHPVLCNYYVTYRCNAKCHFCDIWERPSPYINFSDVYQNLTHLKKLGVKVIDFTGGEPLLHQSLDKFLETAKHLGFITTVTTNTLLYPKYAKRLHQKIDMLHFSLDFSTPSAHNQSRGVDCFDFVMESIKIARKLGERPDILFTVMQNNIEEIEAVYNNICLPNKLLLILNPVFSYNDVNQNISDQNLNTLLKWSKKKFVYLNKAFIKLRKEGGNKIEDPICKAASSTIVISPENKLILPCYHLGIDSFEIKNNLYDLYYSEKVQKLIAMEGKYPACEGCTINCYMQPSFSVNLNRFWWAALASTWKYNRVKGTWKNLFLKEQKNLNPFSKNEIQ